MPLTNNEKQAAYAERQKAAGRTQRKVWAHPEDWPRIKSYVERLNKQREKK